MFIDFKITRFDIFIDRNRNAAYILIRTLTRGYSKNVRLTGELAEFHKIIINLLMYTTRSLRFMELTHRCASADRRRVPYPPDRVATLYTSH